MLSANHRWSSSASVLLLLGLGGVSACGSSTSSPTGTSGGAPDASVADAAPDAALVIFTSRATFTGNLGGIAGADKKCQSFAEAAGLQGRFQAWLSDSKTDAIDRVPDGGPWKKLRDGKLAELVFASRVSWKGFPDPGYGDLFQDERGLAPGGSTPFTWTGTDIGGTKAAKTCSDWTSADELQSGANGERASLSDKQAWTQNGTSPCAELSSLLCYQVP